MPEEIKTAELDPCPFCGGKATLTQTIGGSFYVFCTDCGVEQGFSEPTEAEAIEKWNTRSEYNER